MARIATVAVARPSGAETTPPDGEAGAKVAYIARAHSVGDSHVDPNYSASQQAKPGGAKAGLPTPTADLHAASLHRFLALGLRADRAKAAVDRMARRDVDYGDDRRMCIECSHLGVRGQCIAAQRGRLMEAVRDLQPIPDLLQRCEAFGLRTGLL